MDGRQAATDRHIEHFKNSDCRELDSKETEKKEFFTIILRIYSMLDLESGALHKKTSNFTVCFRNWGLAKETW